MVDVNQEYLKKDKKMDIKQIGKNKVLFKKFCKDRKILIRNKNGLDGRDALWIYLLNNTTFHCCWNEDFWCPEIHTPDGQVFLIKGLDRNLDIII